MSLRRGDRSKTAPKHQNQVAFKHNKGSKKTAGILSIANVGVCDRCYEQIEWRKRYRKYKPIKQPSTCNNCKQRNVKYAYHTICADCAKSLSCCSKCLDPVSKDVFEDTSKENAANKLDRLLESKPAGMRERDRRRMIRQLERDEYGEGSAGSVTQTADDDNDFSENGDMESIDEYDSDCP